MPDQPKVQSPARFCAFRLNERLYGLDISAVSEVTTQTEFTKVPGAPPMVRGYVNLRGQIHLVLDLRVLLALPAIAVTPQSRLLVLKPRVAEALGILVDEIADIVTVDRDAIESIAANDSAVTDSQDGLIHEIAKLDTELLAIVDPVALVGRLATLLQQNPRSRRRGLATNKTPNVVAP